jgi:translation elongation factor P/translation initiation factor 5A
MKTLFIIANIVMGIFLSDNGPQSEVANLKLPKNAVSISKEDFTSKFVKKFTTAKYVKNYKYKYQMKEMLLVFDDVVEYGTSTQEELKERISGEAEEHMAQGIKVSYKTINGKEFIIYEKIKNDEINHIFYSEANHKKRLTGTLILSSKEKAQGEKIFNELLSSITFK